MSYSVNPKRQRLVDAAKDTLEICKKLPENLNIYEAICYKQPVEDIDISNCKADGKHKIIIKNADCLSIAGKLPNTCILNFASANHPGGGFLTGAQAQEESICRRSSLYLSIKDNEMYDINRKDTSKFYTDTMIYSPNVYVVKSENLHPLANHIKYSVITAPAVNLNKVGYMNIAMGKQLETVMTNRIRKIIKVAIVNGQRNIVLGAWGCGVFGNHPKNVAQYFYNVLVNEEYEKYFDNIFFAIYKSNSALKSFHEVFD
jgi:uncharacterized protein (TIGR02452 family)